MSETIAAIATGNVLSAVGIIRLSGERALEALSKVFRTPSGTPVAAFENRKLYYGDLLDSQGHRIDRVLGTVSRAPDSYTGEDTAELHCHGAPIVLREALEALFVLGVRQAAAGEFTRRAFINGKLDLTQAEAVADLIEAQTKEAARNAAGQLGGAVCKKADFIYDGLTEIMAHFHAVLDYPDEDIEPFALGGYRSLLETHIRQLRQMYASFRRGVILKDGVKSAIVGKPNAGKSSLLNALLGYERAIVTDIPGTTRDTIEERVILGGVVLRLSDTAGLRGAVDPIEKLGVKRAKGAAESAELILAVFDGSRPLEPEDRQAAEAALLAPHAIAVINKSDLAEQIDFSEMEGRFEKVCRVSALDKSGTEKLETMIAEIFGGEGDFVSAGETLTNARHYDIVGRALGCIESAKQAMEDGVTPDAVLIEIEAAMSALGELTGKTIREEITAKIFERFCVGK